MKLQYQANYELMEWLQNGYSEYKLSTRVTANALLVCVYGELFFLKILTSPCVRRGLVVHRK